MERVASIAATLKTYLDSLLRRDESGRLYVLDDELGDRASCCTTAEAACLYVLGGEAADLEKAAELIDDVLNRQLPSGAFGQPYYVKKGESGTIDIAEIGAAANSLYHVYRATGNEAAKTSLVRSADYLLTQVAEEQPGAIYKNPNARMHDVLNGDIYAAHTLGRAYELTGSPVYLEQIERTVAHVADRFGKHSPGWWPYTEQWDGSVGMGNSVAYQATIIAFAHPLLPLLPEPLRSRWLRIEEEASAIILQALQDGPNDDNEAPWWCRDWPNVAEISLAFSRVPHMPEANAYVERRLTEIEEGLDREGIAYFRPKVKSDDPERSPVTTTFRKAATFAGILCGIGLDPLADSAAANR
ncbi:hypothetical protein [Paenibacillus flagellatus]|uniref:Uncharacterized protein n=1 Tax=Paenibacillus flagellatus TaxID=2211139 RepID=A0A2V5KNG0_9BACL|nr:hypothetical protein [Paenibacillus flagellatus]PYI52617.1 hypothetical protein DLM86_20835 [Paenibacillus flagellatus]